MTDESERDALGKLIQREYGRVEKIEGEWTDIADAILQAGFRRQQQQIVVEPGDQRRSEREGGLLPPGTADLSTTEDNRPRGPGDTGRSLEPPQGEAAKS